MPLGNSVDVTGLLVRSATGLVLRPDKGGEWRLDTSSRHLTLAGQRVRVTGIRSGFDLIDVKTVKKIANTFTP